MSTSHQLLRSLELVNLERLESNGLMMNNVEVILLELQSLSRVSINRFFHIEKAPQAKVFSFNSEFGHFCIRSQLFDSKEYSQTFFLSG